MAKPGINHIIPFDAETDKEITLIWNGNQAYYNRIIIYNADTMNVVYDKKIESFRLSHIIPANTLSNSGKWIIQCQIYDMDNLESELSDKVFFQTYKTPECYFYELTNGQTIRTASYEAVIYYFQEDYEELQSYKFYLYDGTKTLLNESKTMYDTSQIKYIYKGLENHTVYFFRFKGITVNGMEIDTGFTEIFTDYQVSSTYGIIYAENDPLHGYIKININSIVIQPDDNREYKFKDGMIDLTNDSISYSNGFVIKDNFTLRLRGMCLNHTAELLELGNTQYKMKLSSYVYDNGQIRFKITSPGALGNYILYSDPLVFNDSDMIFIQIRRIDGIYDIDVLIESDFSFYNDLWLGKQVPANPQLYDLWIDTDNLFTYVVDKDVINTYVSDEPDNEDLKTDDLWF